LRHFRECRSNVAASISVRRSPIFSAHLRQAKRQAVFVMRPDVIGSRRHSHGLDLLGHGREIRQRPRQVADADVSVSADGQRRGRMPGQFLTFLHARPDETSRET